MLLETRWRFPYMPVALATQIVEFWSSVKTKNKRHKTFSLVPLCKTISKSLFQLSIAFDHKGLRSLCEHALWPGGYYSATTRTGPLGTKLTNHRVN